MQRTRDKGVKQGTPGHSLALRYELELQEQERGVAHPVSRVNKCFQILDEVIPHLGVYQHVMQLIQQELHVAIYSNGWTSRSKQQQQQQQKQQQACKDAHLMPIPYFIVAERLAERKAGERSKLKAEINSLKEQLYTCEADLEKAISSLDTCRHDLKDREAKLHHLMTQLQTQYAEKEHLQEVIGHNQHSKGRLYQEFDFRMCSLRNTITNLKEENGGLKEYKVVHDKLQESQLLKTNANPSKPATFENEMEQHIAASEKLKLQLLTLQNSQMDELDSWLQSCYNSGSPVLPAEMIHKKKAFKQKTSSVFAELCLLDKHQQTLSERLQQLRSAKRNNSSHTALVLPLHPLNPLIAQEQITSKYAAMISTSSDGGKNFYSLKAAQHCLSCNQKTVLCPHKVCEDDLVIQLPVNSSHIKISRPSFELTKPNPHAVQPVTFKVASNIPINQGLHVATPEFGFLWMKFHDRFPEFKLKVSRNITQELLLKLVEQFYATLLLQDDTAVAIERCEDDSPSSLPESMFEFVRQHYTVKTLAPISCHAFISSLEEFHSGDKALLLLSHALCGNLDGCSVRYALLQSSLVQAVNWTSHSQIPTFLTALYPFLKEEEVEQMALTYISHSDNRFSTQLVIDFMQFLLLTHKDPLVVMLESRLAEQPCHTIGCMLEAEFAEAIEKLVPENTGLLGHRLFFQSLYSLQEKTNSNRQTLPTRNLAYIAAYLYRSSEQDVLKTKVGSAREENKGQQIHSIDSVRILAQRMNIID